MAGCVVRKLSLAAVFAVGIASILATSPPPPPAPPGAESFEGSAVHGDRLLPRGSARLRPDVRPLRAHFGVISASQGSHGPCPGAACAY